MLRDVLVLVALAAVIATFVSANDLLTPEEAQVIDRKLLILTEEELKDSRVTMQRTKTSPNSYVLHTIASHCKNPGNGDCPYKQFQFAALYDVTKKDQSIQIKAVDYGFQAYTKAKNANDFELRKQLTGSEDAYMSKIKQIVDGFIKKAFNAKEVTNTGISWNNGGDVAVEAAYKAKASANGPSPSIQTEWDNTAYEETVRDTRTPAEVKAELTPKLRVTPGTLDLAVGPGVHGQSRVRQTLVKSPITYLLCVIENQCSQLTQSCPYKELQFTASYEVTTAAKAVTATALEYNFLATKDRKDDYKFARVKGTTDRKTPEGTFIWKIKEKLDQKIQRLFNVASINNKDREWQNRGAVEEEQEFAKTQKKNGIQTAAAKVSWSGH